MNEIKVNYSSGETLYAVRFNESGQVALSDGSSFEGWGDNGHTADDYDVSLSEVGSGGGSYIGDFDSLSNITASGRYGVSVFLQSGVDPVDGDKLVGTGQLVWTGSEEIVKQQLAADGLNKISTTEPAGYPSDFREFVVWLVMRWLNEHEYDKNTSNLKVKKANDDLSTTQSVVEVGGVETVGKAS